MTSARTEILPLFPLGSVLFPGLLLPLHIFEDRYRELVRELVDLPEGSVRRFGVVAIKQGREVGADGVGALHEIGCTAELRRVEPHEDGRYDIVTTGVTRFRVHGLQHDRSYLRGQVEFLEERPGDAATAAVLARGMHRPFAGYLRALGDARGEPIEPGELPEDPLVLSYLIAATMLVDLGDKQDLLAAPHAIARLRAELGLLHRETAMLRALSAVPATELTRQGWQPN